MSYFVRFLLLCCTVALAIPTYANALNERDAVVSRQTGKLQIRVHYPITGNARVDADVADWAHQAVDTFQNTYGEEPDLGVPYELETTYSTTRSTPSVLSIVWKTASYTGGAHGNLEITTTTYDMKSGALIDLYDVFENLDTALDVMSRYCTKALTKSLGDMYNDDMGSAAAPPPKPKTFPALRSRPRAYASSSSRIRWLRGPPGRRSWTSPSTRWLTPGRAFRSGANKTVPPSLSFPYPMLHRAETGTPLRHVYPSQGRSTQEQP